MEYSTTLTGNEPIVITIGNFDGIHKGHQRLMERVCELAEQLRCLPVLVTFSPHPLEVVRPSANLQYLTTLDEKLALAGVYGHIDQSIVIHFTPEVAAMSAQEFLDTLRESFAVRGLVVGEDFRLGHNRMGNVEFLQMYGKEYGLEVEAIALEEIEQTRVSSTRIRAYVSEGHIREANDLLGYPLLISGMVVHGDQRGRLLGFPTANLQLEPHKLIPANGVYAVYVNVQKPGLSGDIHPLVPVYIGTGNHADATTKQDFDTYKGVVNIGVRPTFDGQKRMVEAHVLDVSDLELYDQRITLNFIARLRDEQRFSGIDALKTQIASDVQSARLILQQEER